jgi:signal transduction histidine kinase
MVRIREGRDGMADRKRGGIRSGRARSLEGTKGEEGYGFSLSLVRQLVDNANGTMDISSEEGKGTQFLITLPV